MLKLIHHQPTSTRSVKEKLTGGKCDQMEIWSYSKMRTKTCTYTDKNKSLFLILNLLKRHNYFKWNSIKYIEMKYGNNSTKTKRGNGNNCHKVLC